MNAEMKSNGGEWTAREIAQQPAVWLAVAELVARERARLDAFLAPLLKDTGLRIVLTGAGTSAYIGGCLAPALSQHLGRRVDSVATTDIVSGPQLYLQRDVPTLLVSFARSGGSPESVAAVEVAERALDRVHHLVVTCNAEGALAKKMGAAKNACVLVLPDATNDRAFAMTSSFTSMLLVGALAFGAISAARVPALSRAADAALPRARQLAGQLAAKDFERVVYLGSNALQALAAESALKLLELTDGRTVALSQSVLGFRHGPKTIVNGRTLIVVFVSNDAYTRAYDHDLLGELRRDARAGTIVAIGATATPGETLELAEARGMSDLELVLIDVVFAQLLGLAQSLHFGLTPDNPNPSGVVNRVVQGGPSIPGRAEAPMFLGVDGGGTKTAFALIDAGGEIRASHVTGCVSYLSEGLERASALLAEGSRAVLARAGVAPAQVDFAFFALGSYGEDSSVTAMLDAMPESVFDSRRFRVGNDMMSSWAGSLAGADGISAIAGTGSMAYGEYAGRSARCGGWGELIGDEGSAYWIAREGMNLFSRMSDGRVPRGPLHAMARERLGLKIDLDLCAHVYGGNSGARADFAQFAKLVHEASEAGDGLARAIFLSAADQLVQTVFTVRRAIEVPATVTLPVSYSGGAFAGSRLLVETFKSALSVQAKAYEIRTPRFPPVVGAALYAARVAGTPLQAPALARLDAECASAKLPA